MNLPKDSREFVELLNSNGVKYVIVGAHAQAFHARPRLTGDLDILIEAAPANAARVQYVLQQFGFGGVGITEADFLQSDRVIQLGFSPNRIDLVTSLTGVEFADIWATRVSGLLGGVPVPYISKALLIQNKRATGRPKDLADIDALEEQ